MDRVSRGATYAGSRERAAGQTGTDAAAIGFVERLADLRLGEELS